MGIRKIILEEMDWIKSYSDDIDEMAVKVGDIYEVGDDEDFYNTILAIDGTHVVYSTAALGDVTHHTIMLPEIDSLIKRNWWKKVDEIPDYVYDLNESEFDWTEDINSMKLYNVQNLEDGKYYVFHGKKNVDDPQRPGSPPPEWVDGYEGQTIQVIHNDLIGRRVEFIPHGKIQNIKWKEETESVTLDHMAQMFVYGEFSELQGSLTESEFEFDWAEDIPIDTLHVGSKVYIDGYSDSDDTHLYWDEGDYIVLGIIGITDDEVAYETLYTNMTGEGDAGIEYTDLKNARGLVDSGYWKPWDGKQGFGMNESEFDWAEKTPSAEMLPYWGGEHDGTEPGGSGRRNKIFIYTDEDGIEHSVKIGGTKYLRYDGVGGVSFYDSSITQDEIDNLNNHGAAAGGDPFFGKYEVKMTRPEYNEYVRNGRMKLQVWDNFYPINESNDFDWMVKVKDRPIQIGGMVISVRRPNEGEIPVDYVGIGDKVRTSPTTDHPDGFVFTIEDVREVNGRVGVWGSDIPEDKRMAFDGSKNYHFTHALVRESVLTESEFDWAIETPEGYDVHEKKRAVEFGPVLEKVFEGTRFRVTLGDPLIGIEDDTGIYLDWDVDEVLTMNEIINQFRQEVNISQDDELREEYREVYMLLLDYFGDN
jgi:hypothetical protein